MVVNLPTLKAPIPGKPLRIYLATTPVAVGALLAQEDANDQEQPIFYISRQLTDVETRYPVIEQLCLALVYASQRLRRYFLSYKLYLMIKNNPIRYLLTRPVLTGRLSRWLLQLSESDITCVTLRAINGQAVIDMMTTFSGERGTPLVEEIPGGLVEESSAFIEKGDFWTLYFDGSSTSTAGGAGIMLTNPSGCTNTLSLRLDFPCTNNIAEYEGFLAGVMTARTMGAKKLKIMGDSSLVLNQVRGNFSVKEPALAPYRSLAQKLMAEFHEVQIEHIPGLKN